MKPLKIKTFLLIFRRKLLVSLFSCAFFGFAFAERLPLRVYTSADGLATSVIHHIYRDSQGFLWFSGRGVLSRFDGYEFTSYRFSETKTAPLVHSFLESRDGKYFWIASDDGFYRAERRDIENVRPTSVTLQNGVRSMNARKVFDQSFWAVHETPSGELLVGSAGGLFLAENKEADAISLREIVFSRSAKDEKLASVRDFADAPDGSLWIAADTGLVRRLPDGRFLTYEVPRVIATGNEGLCIRVDAAGRIWAAYRSGVFILMPESAEETAGLPDLSSRLLPIEGVELSAVGEIKFPEKTGMIKLKFGETKERAGQAVSASIQDLFQSSDGKIWIPTADSLYIFEGGKYRRGQDKRAPCPARLCESSKICRAISGLAPSAARLN